MDTYLDKGSDYSEVLDGIKSCDPDGSVCCTDEAVFNLAKVVLVKEKLAGITLQLVDEQGYAIRQVTSKRPADDQPSDRHLSTRQAAVIRALEKVLMHCKKEGIKLVGYSDELVAMPIVVRSDDVSPAVALDIDTHGVYRGADSMIENEKLE
ncbi:response regulator [Amphritea sp. 1_MG-2023]|uniref:response regulator n=1 Tax=Amphritea sp. 1_MG-2023 TaxID=3062670 RepID=UPI0026E461B9|nr:response regulator [Amphritea sp. 1_MG-2023]MDO6564626.1 response regulator [Amphritea sp. 1_MG-2023]